MPCSRAADQRPRRPNRLYRGRPAPAARDLVRGALTLDFGRQVAIILTAILHLIQDAEQPCQLVRQLVGALAPGSYVVISHAAADIGNGDMASMASRLNELMAQQTSRAPRPGGSFFAGSTWSSPAWSGWPDCDPALAIDTAAPAQIWAGQARAGPSTTGSR